LSKLKERFYCICWFFKRCTDEKMFKVFLHQLNNFVTRIDYFNGFYPPDFLEANSSSGQYSDPK
jgi:hypothetical protein